LLSARGDFEWAWDHLSGVLDEMLEQKLLSSRVYIILDAIDECEAESRVLILDWIKKLVDKTLTPTSVSRSILKALVTGRPDGDYIDQISAFPTLAITDTDTASDIQALIDKQVKELAQCRRLSPDVTRTIIQFLETNAHGIFLWVVLIIKEAERRDECLSDEVIASKLSAMPLTPIDTYEIIVQSIPPSRKQDMWRVIRWLVFGSRSLTLSELEQGLCLETGISNWYDFARDLTFLCGSLIRLDGPKEEVRFVHQTAGVFVEKFAQASSTADIGGLDMDSRSANEHLALICVQYLLRKDVLRELEKVLLFRTDIYSTYVETIRFFLRLYPFLRYAIDGWAFHLRAVSTPPFLTSTLVRKLLSAQTTRDVIMALTYFLSKHESCAVPTDQTPLHLAPYFNIPWLAQIYISENGSSAHATTPMNDTPLVWASEMGSTESARMLLDAGADPNELEANGWSALHWAARNGYLSVARLLMKHGARLYHPDSQGYMPLDWAFDRGHWDVVRFFDEWIAENDHG
jgi:Ankyrin repeats (3 copies)